MGKLVFGLLFVSYSYMFAYISIDTNVDDVIYYDVDRDEQDALKKLSIMSNKFANDEVDEDTIEEYRNGELDPKFVKKTPKKTKGLIGVEKPKEKKGWFASLFSFGSDDKSDSNATIDSNTTEAVDSNVSSDSNTTDKVSSEDNNTTDEASSEDNTTISDTATDETHNSEETNEVDEVVEPIIKDETSADEEIANDTATDSEADTQQIDEGQTDEVIQSQTTTDSNEE
jgi:hypothetical protein